VSHPPVDQLGEDGDQFDRLRGETVGDLLLVGIVGLGEQAALDERGEPVGEDV
jgi:hypothetical protein